MKFRCRNFGCSTSSKGLLVVVSRRKKKEEGGREKEEKRGNHYLIIKIKKDFWDGKMPSNSQSTFNNSN